MPAIAAVSRDRRPAGIGASSPRIWSLDSASSLPNTARPACVRPMTWRRPSPGERDLRTSPSASNLARIRLRYPASRSSQRRISATSASSWRASSKMILASVSEYGVSSSPSRSSPSTLV